jgi:hypothetical protein
MQLSEHFSLAELTVTNTGLDNSPDESQEANLIILAAFLEKVRHVLHDQPVTIDSAFRSAAVNAAVGGVPDSAHALGYAADLTCDGYGPPFQVARALSAAADEGEIKFDQLIYEQTWVHISRDPRLRGQRLTHVPANGSYIDEIVGP